MANKRNDACLAKVGKDEPVFTLRAGDRFAPMLVQLWADLAATQRHNDEEKITGAKQIAIDMMKWQQTNKAKFPD